MSVIEVCVLVLTIIFGMAGIYFILVLRSIREVTEATKASLKVVNDQLPEIMQDLQVSLAKVRSTTESVQGGVQQATTVVGALSPVALTTSFLGGAKGGWELWRKIRRANASARAEQREQSSPS